MQKLYRCLFLFILISSNSFAQTDSLSKADKAMLDSMMKNDEFLKLMGEKAKNSLDVTVGIGNGAFSTHNNAANATGVDNKIIYTPSLVYHTKNGFSIGATAFLTSDSVKAMDLYQTGLSAGYQYEGKKINAGISYTRYLSDKNKYNSKSIYQNDVYGFIKKAKGLFQPGLSLGFDNGQYKEADQASVVFKRPFNPRGDTTISGIDSTNNKANYFSVTASVEHDFSFYKIFNKDDELDFVPSLMLNFGDDDLDQVHTNTINKPLVKRLLARRKKNPPANKFEAQSIAASLDFTYGIGKFFLQPNLYLDYYLPETNTQRLTAIFAVTAGFSF